MHADKSNRKDSIASADRKAVQADQKSSDSNPDVTSVAQHIIKGLQKKADLRPSSRGIGDIQRMADFRMSKSDRSGIIVQPKLTIGEPGDPYEKEADKIATEVVRDMHVSGGAVNAKEDAGVSIQKKALEEEELQMKPSLSASGQMMPSVQLSEDSGSGEAPADFESAVNAAKGSGQTLDEDTSEQMGSAMGSDFSGVKVHTDSNSDQLSRSIEARAFTTGSDIFFRKGEYDPGSKPGQELLAHELTHVVQQGAAGSTKDTPVQKKSVDGIQRAMEPAYVNDTAQLHQVDSTGVDNGVVRGGKKFRAGDEIEADQSVHVGPSNEWIAAQGGGKTGYLRTGKVVMKSLLSATSDPVDESSPKADGFSEFTDLLGGSNDTASGGVEAGYLKEVSDGFLKSPEAPPSLDGKEAPAPKSNGDAESAKSGLDIASGVGDGLTGLFGMIASAKELISGNNDKWENLEQGFGFVSSTAKGASGVNKVVDSIAKSTGSEKGAGESDTAGKYLGAIADGLGAVKDSALGVIGLYKLYKVKSDSKAKDAAAVFKSFTNAALSAAKVAKNAYDLIGNGIPMALVYTIPALSIAVSAINVIIRLADAFKAGGMKEEMEGLANTDRSKVATDLGVPLPTEANVDSSPVFYGDRRGTFPHYKTYFRTRKEVRAGVKNINAQAEAEKQPLADKIASANVVATSAANKTSGINDHKTAIDEINASVPVSVSKSQDLIKAGVDARNTALDEIKVSVSESVTKYQSRLTKYSNPFDISLNRDDALKEIREIIYNKPLLSDEDKAALYTAIASNKMEDFTAPFADMTSNYSNPSDISLKTAEALAEIKGVIDGKGSLTVADKTELYKAIESKRLEDFSADITTTSEQRQLAFLAGVYGEVKAEVDAAGHLEADEKDSIKTELSTPVSAAEYTSRVVIPLTTKSEGLLTAKGLAKLNSIISASTLPGVSQAKFIADIGTPNTQADFDQKIKVLAQKDVHIDQYELGDKMAEINDKRKVSGWTDVVLELVSIAGDITTIAVGATGIGAAIGQGIKAGAAGAKAVHAGSKFVQKAYRDKGAGDGDKSTSTKHKEYVNHAKFIYKQIAALQVGDTAREKQLEKYVRATGVNYEMWQSLRYNPQDQLEMMVDAMKKRS